MPRQKSKNTFEMFFIFLRQVSFFKFSMEFSTPSKYSICGSKSKKQCPNKKKLKRYNSLQAWLKKKVALNNQENQELISANLTKEELEKFESEAVFFNPYPVKKTAVRFPNSDDHEAYLEALKTKIGKLDEYSDHIYNPFAVPAAGYAKKWILINTPKDQKISQIHLTLETVEGESQKYDIHL